MLQEALTRLYTEILTHLARLVKFFGEKSMGEFRPFTTPVSSVLSRFGVEVKHCKQSRRFGCIHRNNFISMAQLVQSTTSDSDVASN